MKLYYFQDPKGNFGDDLNPWLWDSLLPEFFDADDTRLFVGIGTLLNHRLPAKAELHIVGSGFGYGSVPRIDKRFIFHAVRGYETARVLNLDAKLVITDPAVLLSSMTLPHAAKAGSATGFIPHCQSSRNFDWESVCREAGLKYISAEWSVDKVLEEMRTCKTMVCEAMHGAIAADALRIPWIPVFCYDYIATFKWKDWLSTVNLPYEPIAITSLYDVERNAPTAIRLKSRLKRGLHSVNVWSSNWTPAPPRPTGRAEYERAAAQLSAATRSQTFLSADSTVEQHTDRYLTLIDKLRRKPWL